MYQQPDDDGGAATYLLRFRWWDLSRNHSPNLRCQLAPEVMCMKHDTHQCHKSAESQHPSDSVLSFALGPAFSARRL